MFTTYNQLKGNTQTEPVVIRAPQQSVYNRRPNGTFGPGNNANPGGKPAGTENFRSKWLRVIDKIAAKNNLLPDDIEEQLLIMAFNQAKAANFSFYKDIQDRVYGKATDHVKMEVNDVTEEAPLTLAMLEAIKFYEQKNREAIEAESDRLLTPKPNEQRADHSPEPSGTQTPAAA